MKRQQTGKAEPFATKQVAQMHQSNLAGFQLAGYRKQLPKQDLPNWTDVVAQNRLLLASFLYNLDN